MTSTNTGNHRCWTHHRTGLGTREVAHVSWRLGLSRTGQLENAQQRRIGRLATCTLQRCQGRVQRYEEPMPGGHPELLAGALARSFMLVSGVAVGLRYVREHEARQSFVEIPRNRDKEAHDVVKLAAFQIGEHMSPTSAGGENGSRELAIANLGS